MISGVCVVGCGVWVVCGWFVLLQVVGMLCESKVKFMMG